MLDLYTGICSGYLWKKYIYSFNWTICLFNRGKLCIFRNKRPIFEPDNNLFPRKIISKQHYTCTNVCRTRYTVCHNRCDILVGICASSEGDVEMLRYTITEIVSTFLSKSTALMLFIYGLYILSFYPPGEYCCLPFGEYILLAICDTRYFTLIFFVILTVYFVKLESTPNSMVLSRTETFLGYFLKRTIAMVVVIFFLIVVHVSAALFIRILVNALFVETPDLSIVLPKDRLEILRAYRSLSSSSFAAITATILYLISGYTLYYTFLSALFLLVNKKLALAIVLVNFFVTLCGVQYGVDAWHPTLFLKNYISLPYALMFGMYPWSQIITFCAWGLVSLLVGKRWWCGNRC